MLLLQTGNRRYIIDFPERAEVEILKTGGLPIVANLPAEIDEAFNNSAGGNGAWMPFLLIATNGRAADPSTVLAEWADEYEKPARIAVIPDGYGTFCYPEYPSVDLITAEEPWGSSANFHITLLGGKT